MIEYFDYIFHQIILDVEKLPEIWSEYNAWTVCFVIFAWIIWIALKNMLFVMPIFILWNITVINAINQLKSKI